MVIAGGAPERRVSDDGFNPASTEPAMVIAGGTDPKPRPLPRP